MIKTLIWIILILLFIIWGAIALIFASHLSSEIVINIPAQELWCCNTSYKGGNVLP